MFSRRRSAKKTTPVNYNTPASTTTAGTTAAQLAFFTTSPNATPLSSAAAAAALRSHTTSPEPVGSIQTKRMVRRLSNSSRGSGSIANGNERPALGRSNSNGSMTERTFRTPSPAQRNIASPDPDAPPVPAIPQNGGRPSSSLDAPQRIVSPTPADGRRSASADQAALAAPTSSRKAKRLSNVAEGDELEKEHRDFARNFSRRDMSPPASPPISPVATGTSRTPSAQQNGQPIESGGQKYTAGTGAWFNRPAGAPAASTRTSSMSSFTLNPVTQPYQGTRPISAAGYNFPRTSYDSQRSYSMTSDTTYNRSETVYDPNSRTFVPKTPAKPQNQPALQAARRAKSMETVYDPNTRTFVPKPEVARYDSPASSSQSTPVIAPKKQRSFPAMDSTSRPPAKASGRYSSFTVQPRDPASPRSLHKQPSVVREDQEAEQRAEVKSLPLGQPVEKPRTAQPATLPAKTYATPTATQDRSASLDVPRPALDAASRGRNTSQSPQRSAHFSPSPILKPELHAPPPRDLSPAKSAMKQSPASSVGRASPTAAFTLPPIAGVQGPSSETSETPSLSAIDGGYGKKKKSVRVSFDEQPRDLAPATAPTLRDRSPETSDDMEDDAIMKPRPALPSFGSVRRDRVQPAIAEKVTEMPPERHEVSSDHALGGILRSSLEPLPPEVTSKESAGYISDESSEADHPVSAPSSGAAQTRQVDQQDVPLTRSGQPMVRDFAAADMVDSGIRGGDLKIENTDVPAIALMPPTPKLDDESKRDLIGPSETTADEQTRGRNSMEGISIPGGWKDDVDRTPTPVASVTEPLTPPTLERSLSAEDSAATMTVTPIELTHSPQPLSDIDEDTDDSAAFSDAVEDPSDLEDEGGFASLDAIVESPLPSPTGPRTIPLPLGQGDITESPDVKQASKTPEVFTGSVPALIQAANLGGAMDSSPPASPTTGGASWTEATQYWSQLSREKRQELEREALSSDDEPAKLPAVAAPKRMKPRRVSSDEVPTLAATRTQQPQSQPAMRKTMRASSGPVAAASSQADGGVHMRSSMRTDGRMRPSSRDGPPPVSPVGTGALQKRSLRPNSSGGPPTRPYLTTRDSDDSIYSQQDVPVKKAAPRPKVEPPKVSARLQKELAKAEDSDSESSFKKRRKGVASLDTQGRYSMRRSMRGGPTEQPLAPPAAPVERRPETPTSERGGRFGFRSLSPTFGRSKAATRETSQDSGLKTTLRGAQSKGASAAGGPKESGMKSSLRSHSYTTSKSSNKSTPAPQSRLRSRFADSDDEDEDAPRRTFFKSRFADSDDESDPGSPQPRRADLAPVRGIPRRKGQEDGDSTDLEDEDDNPAVTASKRFTALIGPHPGETEKVMAAARRNLGLDDESASAQHHDVKEGEALSKGSLRQKPAEASTQSTAKARDVEIVPSDKKKKGFMNSILRRNRQSSSSVPKVTPSSPVEMPASPVIAAASPQTPQQERPTMPSSPPTSAPKVPQLERPSSSTGMPTGKLIRRESYQMWLQRANSSELLNSNAPASSGPTSNLQPTEETNPYTLDLNSSPPSSPPEQSQVRPSAAERPATSDGFSPEAIKLAQTMRPDLNRNSQSGPLAPRRVQIQAGEEGSEPGEREPRDIYSQKTGRKKKFGMLRKAFGLKD